jgi:beta-phosphoglucomutase-like phosphatase (HAD superfamily)
VHDTRPFRQPPVGRHGAQPLRLREHRATCLSCHTPVYTIAAVPVRAFLFDFDGLIIDTETASRAGWAWLYERHGHELPPEKWALMVGTVNGWDPWSHLVGLVGRPLDFDRLNEERYAHELSLLETEQLRPGIAEYFDFAQRNGLKRAIVSSATRDWIDMHLARLERQVGWDAIVTADGDATRAKPSPTLYLEALERIGVPAGEAVAFEDSPNGAQAAQAAGIYVVGVPNAITRDLGLHEHTDVLVDSLADLPPDDLLARVA